jgi:hypothetical protein
VTNIAFDNSTNRRTINKNYFIELQLYWLHNAKEHIAKHFPRGTCQLPNFLQNKTVKTKTSFVSRLTRAAHYGVMKSFAKSDKRITHIVALEQLRHYDNISPD